MYSPAGQANSESTTGLFLYFVSSSRTKVSLLHFNKYRLIVKLIQNIFPTSWLLALSPRCLKGPLTGSFTLLKIHWLEYTVGMLDYSFYLSLWEGKKQAKHEGAGSQEGNPWQPDIKMVQESSRTSQVAPGKTKVRVTGGKEQVILKS